MAVVNVKVKFIRPEYSDLKDWCSDTDRNYYIGRKGVVFIDGRRYPEKDSPFANPFKLGKDGDREEIIAKYELYIRDKIEKGEVMIKEIKGKNLGCWCSPEPCHGDVLLRLIRADCPT